LYITNHYQKQPDIQRETKVEKAPDRINHLKERINAVNLNKERIERRFQDI